MGARVDNSWLFEEQIWRKRRVKREGPSVGKMGAMSFSFLGVHGVLDSLLEDISWPL